MVKLVQVEEEKRILIESGCQLLLDSSKSSSEKEEDLRDASFVSQLKFSAANSAASGFEPTSLKLKVLLAEPEDDSLTSKNHNNNNNNRQSSSAGEICQKLIDVPKFAMFTFAQPAAAAGGDRSAISPDTDVVDDEKYIRLCYRLADSSKFEQVSRVLPLRQVTRRRRPAIRVNT